MQSVCRTLRRSYATYSNPLEGRGLTAPKAVRERRAARGLKDTVDGLTPSEFATYQRSLVLGNLMGKGENGGEPTPKQWLAKLNDKRNRLRGIRIETQKGGQKKVVAMGQKIYLPNIIFRMVRNNTPAGMPYNPYEATFRIPQSVTKTDVRSYLLAVYGVETTYIRTHNFLSPIYRAANGSWTRTKPHRTYKRAVVGLVKPFLPPAIVDYISGPDKVKREAYLEKSFGIQSSRDMLKAAYLRMTKKGSDKWSWRNLATTKRGQILKAIGRKRLTRRLELDAAGALIDEARKTGQPADRIDSAELHALASSFKNGRV
jgi:large subunit ribosomal protein L23